MSIYCVRQNQAKTNHRVREKRIQYSKQLQIQNSQKKAHSLSTKCPKVERKSPFINKKISNNLFKSTKNGIESSMSSDSQIKTFERQGRKAFICKFKNKPIVFRKIEQRKIQKVNSNITRKIDNIQKQYLQPFHQQKNNQLPTNLVSARINKENQYNHKKIDMSSNDNMSQRQENESYTMLGNYAIQPNKDIFLCRECLEFYFIVEFKTHFNHCQRPVTYSQYCGKWVNLCLLIQELNKKKRSNEIGQLIDLMNWYLERQDQTKLDNHILHSEQLQRILCRRNQIEIKFVNNNDLFDLIENLGQYIENCEQKSSKLSIWNICY